MTEGYLIGVVGASNLGKYLSTAGKVLDALVAEKMVAHPDLKLTSGGSPLGGSDIVIECVAAHRGVEIDPFYPHPLHFHWDCDDPNCYGYKDRNEDIAKSVKELYNIVIDYPNWFCKHCKITGHLDNGGCWTMQLAKREGAVVNYLVMK